MVRLNSDIQNRIDMEDTFEEDNFLSQSLEELSQVKRIISQMEKDFKERQAQLKMDQKAKSPFKKPLKKVAKKNEKAKTKSKNIERD